MRPRFRLRTALIAIALSSPPLAGLAVVARHGGPAGFIRHHTSLSVAYSHHADRSRQGIRNFLTHAAPGHTCARCLQFDRPVAALIAEERLRLRDYKCKARWHGFLAGPAWLQRLVVNPLLLDARI